MKVKFYDDRENLLIEYDGMTDFDEIRETKDLLEFENDYLFKVKVKVEE